MMLGQVYQRLGMRGIRFPHAYMRIPVSGQDKTANATISRSEAQTCLKSLKPSTV